MKRKMLFAVCTATCLCFGLTACGVEHAHIYTAEWTTDATYHWHECMAEGDCDAKEKDKASHADSNGDGNCDICGYSMSDGSQTVTEEQWRTSITQIGTVSFTVTQSEESSQYVTKYDSVNGRVYNITENLQQSDEKEYQIITKDGENYYEYSSSDGISWTRTVVTSDYYDSYISQMPSILSEILNNFADGYESFTYADGKYTAESFNLTSYNVTVSVEITFENNALKTVKYGNSTRTDFVEIGTVEITVPTE